MSKFRIVREIRGDSSSYVVQRLVKWHPDDVWEDVAFDYEWNVGKMYKRTHHNTFGEAERYLFLLHPPKPTREVVKEYDL